MIRDLTTLGVVAIALILLIAWLRQRPSPPDGRVVAMRDLEHKAGRDKLRDVS